MYCLWVSVWLNWTDRRISFLFFAGISREIDADMEWLLMLQLSEYQLLLITIWQFVLDDIIVTDTWVNHMLAPNMYSQRHIVVYHDTFHENDGYYLISVIHTLLVLYLYFVFIARTFILWPLKQNLKLICDRSHAGTLVSLLIFCTM